MITSQSALATESISSQSSFNSQQDFIIPFHPRLGLFLGCSDMALIVQQIHYWLQNPNAGYLFKDGRKRIFNGYKEWAEQFYWLTPRQIGRMIRSLEKLGWLKSERFHTLKRHIGFIGRTPAFQEENQRKWYSLNYQKIFADTGFDLLFNQEKDNSTLEPKRRKRAPRANIPNQDIAIYQNQTLQCTENEQSSIQRKPEITKSLYEESENFNELPRGEVVETSGIIKESQGEVKKEVQEKNLEHAGILEEDQCSAALPPTEKIVKHREVKDGVRPPRQAPRLKYPDGPWLTDNGCLNEDFLNDRANIWRTGDTLESKSFGAMAVEDVIAHVACHYQKPENHSKLETHWDAYVRKSKRYITNVKDRVDGGIQIPVAEQPKFLAKIPAVISEPVEPIYEQPAINMPTTAILNCLEVAALPPAPDLKVDTPPPPKNEHGCLNPDAYKNVVKDEDLNYWEERTPRALVHSIEDKKDSENLGVGISEVNGDQDPRAKARALVEKLKDKKFQIRTAKLRQLAGDEPMPSHKPEEIKRQATLTSLADVMQAEAIKSVDVTPCSQSASCPQGEHDQPVLQNPEQLPIPTSQQVEVNTKVWVYRVMGREWVRGEVQTIEERFGDPYEWKIRLNSGKLLTARSLNQLRLRS